MTPSLVLDLDGTLIDVKTRHWTVYKTIIKSLGGIPLGKQSYWNHKRHHKPIATILSYSFDNPKKQHTQFVSQFIASIELPNYLSFDTVFPFTHTILQQLQTHYRLHLVTVRNDTTALNQQLDNLNLSGYFHSILTKNPGGNPAQTKVSLIQHNHITPVAVIGDTQADIQAAHILNITSIAVLSGMRTKQFLTSLHPTHIINDISYLPPPTLAITIFGSILYDTGVALHVHE